MGAAPASGRPSFLWGSNKTKPWQLSSTWACSCALTKPTPHQFPCPPTGGHQPKHPPSKSCGSWSPQGLTHWSSQVFRFAGIHFRLSRAVWSFSVRKPLLVAAAFCQSAGSFATRIAWCRPAASQVAITEKGSEAHWAPSWLEPLFLREMALRQRGNQNLW